MRAAPAFETELPREPAWLIASACLGLLALACGSAWAWEGAAPRWLLPAAVALAFGIWWVASWRRPPQHLRWDGQEWWLQSLRGRPVARNGRLAVAVDLDGWLLLRFEPAAASRRALWLAASRRRVGADWPALRRAVYCARPAETEFTATDSSA